MAWRRLLAEASASTVLEVPLPPGGRPCTAERAGRTVTRLTPLDGSVSTLPDKGFDAVVCAGTLAHLPDEDIPWLLESLFRYARRCLYLSVSTTPVGGALDAGIALRGHCSPSWWLTRVERASARNPAVRWKIVLHDEKTTRRPMSLVREGGRRADGKPPTVWVLKDHKAGHTTQSVGLADAVGFPYEIKELAFNLFNHFSNRIRGATTLGLSAARSAPCGPPWPDLVISTGRRTAPVARWIGQQSRGRTRLVQLGRRGGETVDAFDLVVACAHFRLPLHPRRMEIIAPLNAVTPDRLARAAEHWRGLFAAAPRPHVVLVVGGTCARYRLDGATAQRLGERVRTFAAALGGSLFVITSPRTGAEATAGLRIGLGGSDTCTNGGPGSGQPLHGISRAGGRDRGHRRQRVDVGRDGRRRQTVIHLPAARAPARAPLAGRMGRQTGRRHARARPRGRCGRNRDWNISALDSSKPASFAPRATSIDSMTA